jgi:histidinol-phosphate phosphatase family protein
MMLDVALVIPTIGRESLGVLLAAVTAGPGPRPAEIVVVDDRPGTHPAPAAGVRVLRSGGRGPAAARNTGWRACSSRWVCFVDDDVIPTATWASALRDDLAAADAAGAAGSQGVLDVPVPGAAPPSDDIRRTLRLATARWITADMAYRRDVLLAVGGFDERFPRAYREDSDLALRVVSAGHEILAGTRRSVHPVATATWWTSVRVQRGNRDDALMRRKFGRGWRTRIGEGRGRLPAHTGTTACAAVALGAAGVRRYRLGAAAAAAWAALTLQFTARRLSGGPRDRAEALRMLASSVLIPPVAVAQRLLGEWQHRGATTEPVLAVLFDRDDTLIHDGPFLADPSGVVPMPGAREMLDRLRGRGVRLAVVTNQSGIARGLLTVDEVTQVNAEVARRLGPFDGWHICPHGEDDGCTCRKPAPGMVRAAAVALGVPPARCVMVGDTGGDVTAAVTAGARAVLVPTRRTRSSEIVAAQHDPRVRVAPTLRAALRDVLRECR